MQTPHTLSSRLSAEQEAAIAQRLNLLVALEALPLGPDGQLSLEAEAASGWMAVLMQLLGDHAGATTESPDAVTGLLLEFDQAIRKRLQAFVPVLDARKEDHQEERETAPDLAYMLDKDIIRDLVHYLSGVASASNFQFEERDREALGGVWPGLESKPWFEPGDHPVLEKVAAIFEGEWEIFREEYDARKTSLGEEAVGRYEASHRYEVLKDNAWGGVVLWKDQAFTEIAMDAFPRSVALLRALPDYLLPYGEIVFLILKPGVALPAHHDVTNIQISTHLGIDIPEDCGIRVAGETRRWEEGKVLMFDHTFLHEAWNHDAQDRVVLVTNVLHPALSVPAQRALQIGYEEKLF